MKNILITLCLIAPLFVHGQTDKAIFKSYEPGFYQKFILRDVRHVNETLSKQAPEKQFQMDQSGMNLPNERSLYTEIWAQESLSQGNAGTCWAYGGISFFEAEVMRMQNKEIKLSEIYIVYWEYVEKIREFVRTRGESHFSQGGQANGVTRIISMHGVVPETAYSGLLHDRKYHTHDALMEELLTYLKYVKTNAVWDENHVISTARSILDYHIGAVPESFEYEGKTYTPETFRDDYLKIITDDYIDLMSSLEYPFYQKGKYDVSDNWWNCSNYLNLPLEDYMVLLNKSLEAGFSVAIGGDVSEAGFSRVTNVALIPDFDIRSKDIGQAAREFRFQNNSTADDHIMHIVGYTKEKGVNWYLVKDSSSGSRNVDESGSQFGYYFMHEDYIKLKILTFTVHKSMLD